ncbi:MAG: DUF4352 domain-containing protein [Oscillospiraceae bacterium]|nr:DUF4352 domain-containing protein [Oscillospiraceae bacterium]
MRNKNASVVEASIVTQPPEGGKYKNGERMKVAKMVKCKTCGADIAKNAKVCPQCGGKVNRMTPGVAAAICIIIVVAVILIVAVIASSSSGDETGGVEQTAGQSGTTASEETQTADGGESEDTRTADGGESEDTRTAESDDSGESEDINTVDGTTKTIGDWEITATSVEVVDSVSLGLLTEYQASEGCKFVKVNMTITNTGTELDYFQSFSTYAKVVYGEYEYSPTMMTGVDEDLTYESVNPLITVSGFLAFEIPDEVINSGETLSMVVSDVYGESASITLW